MKKVLAITFLLCFLLVLTGCGVKEADPGLSPEQTEEEAGEGQSGGESAPPDNLGLTDQYKAPPRKICFDVPPYQMVGEGYATVFNRGDIFYIYNPIYDDDHTKELYESLTSTVEILPALTDRFLRASKGYFNNIPVDLFQQKSEPVTIAGLEMTRFEGEVLFKNPEDRRYIVGYSFFKDGAAAFIAGVVSLSKKHAAYEYGEENVDAHLQELADEVRVTTDAMIRTLRDERR